MDYSAYSRFLNYPNYPDDLVLAQAANYTPNDITIMYTDGSGTTSDKPAGIGVVVLEPGKLPKLIAENIGLGTNNRAELLAIWRSLIAVPDIERSLRIYSDSEYAIGSVMKNWNSTANLDIIQKIKLDLSVRRNVVLSHVDGHSGVAGNEMADRLANMGRKLIGKVSVF